MLPMSYQMHELVYLTLAPARAASDMARFFLNRQLNPWGNTLAARNIVASAELFERLTRRYAKPQFGFTTTDIAGLKVAIQEEVVWQRPFCRLLNFKRDPAALRRPQPRLLIVAPMSGYYATLLRGTVEAFLPYYDVYITDWANARMVPLASGSFGLDDYIDYLIEILQFLDKDAPGAGLHTMGVCQPAVPLIAATALLSASGEPGVPASMVLMGGPIDTRRGQTTVNRLAERRGTQWFRDNCIETAPFPYPGAGRAVYPGFLQLSGFMAMNLDRHFSAHLEMFNHLVAGDGDSMEKKREFYDEYMAVMDLDAQYYLETVERVFVEHQLPRGEMRHGGQVVDLTAISASGLLTIEGENDDISGIGQTEAAQDLCTSIPANRKAHYVQPKVGHYGVFNGSRFRAEIAPRIRDFINNIEHDARRAATAVQPLQLAK